MTFRRGAESGDRLAAIQSLLGEHHRGRNGPYQRDRVPQTNPHSLILGRSSSVRQANSRISAMLDRSPEAEGHPAIPGRGPSGSPGPASRPLAILWALSLVALIAAFQWPIAQRPLTPSLGWSNDSAVVVGLVAGAWILTALLGGLYRPFGPEFGLDALAVPLAVTSLGLSRGVLVVGLGAFLGSLALDARERTWRPMVAAGRAGRLVLSSLAAGGLVAGLRGPAHRGGSADHLGRGWRRLPDDLRRRRVDPCGIEGASDAADPSRPR